ncbi:hypothetical protein NPIL_9371 [Nephila pilipes]|uniref:Uncharacterized protein n=1 Tax=Nephila pilipes TaxID=299642 RepID=A0A8X6MVX1_NEPPI|nr:hypothetical protein NPIL_9371 [Nephila pilipes]
MYRARGDPPRKNGRMGWMAGKEHSSGPVIQTHSPIFFGFLLVPTLVQRPFTDGRQRPFRGYVAHAWEPSSFKRNASIGYVGDAWELSSVPSETISALIRGMDQSDTTWM